jgi:hypothetical protein
MVADQLRELGIDTALDADEELPMEAQTIIKDLIFSLQRGETPPEEGQRPPKGNKDKETRRLGQGGMSTTQTPRN